MDGHMVFQWMDNNASLDDHGLGDYAWFEKTQEVEQSRWINCLHIADSIHPINIIYNSQKRI